MSKISALDLSGDQTTAIEQAVGIPIQRWGSDPDVSALLICRHMLAQVNGDGLEKYQAMSNRDILALVSLEDGETNPTPPSEP